MITKLTVVGLVLLGACRAPQRSALGDARESQVAGDTVGYDPARVTLVGALKTEQRYGPPNFGETPEVDQRLTAVILELDQAITVLGSDTDDVNIDTFDDVSELQLVGVSNELLAQIGGRRVTVEGVLFEGHTGFHYRNVLMTVTTIEPDTTNSQ